MSRKKDYIFLKEYIEKYFRSKSYSIDNFDKKIRTEIKKNSFLFFEYDVDENVINIINSSNEDDFISIDLTNESVIGEIYIPFNKDIDPFNRFSDYIYNKDLLQKCLNYTELSIKGVSENGKYGFLIGVMEENNDIISSSIFSMFSNEVEFLTDFNLRKNKFINEKDKFEWFLRSFLILRRRNKDLSYKIVVDSIPITNALIYNIFEDSKGSSLEGLSIEFRNCEFSLTEEAFSTFGSVKTEFVNCKM